MKNVKKIGVALCLAATTSIVPVFASNTNKSTAGTLLADSDKYTSLNYFNEVEFEKAFAFTNLSLSNFQIGAATRFNNMYLAGRYDGNFWGNLEGENSESSNKEGTHNVIAPEFDSGSKEDSKYTFSNVTDNNSHVFDILFGIKNMGFKLKGYLDFDSTITTLNNKNQSFDKNNLTEEYPEYKDYSSKSYNDSYDFELSWGGMTFNLDKTLIKPTVNFSVDYSNNQTIESSKTVYKVFDKSLNKNLVDTTTTVSTDNMGDSHTELWLGLGSEFVWGKGTSFMQVLDVFNYVGFNLYPENRSYSKTNTVDNITKSLSEKTTTEKFVTGKVNWTDSIDTNYRFEYKPVEKLTLGFKAGIFTRMEYDNPGLTTTKETKVNYMGDKKVTTITEKYDNGSSDKITIDGKHTPISYTSGEKEDKTFETMMFPTFGVGMSYAVKPNFTINLGYKGELPTITVTDQTVNTATTTTTYSNPETKEVATVSKTEKTEREVSVTTGNYYSTLSTGFVWGIGKYCALDVNVNVMKTDRKPSFNDMWTAGWDLGFSFKM